MISLSLRTLLGERLKYWPMDLCEARAGGFAEDALASLLALALALVEPPAVERAIISARESLG